MSSIIGGNKPLRPKELIDMAAFTSIPVAVKSGQKIKDTKINTISKKDV